MNVFRTRTEKYSTASVIEGQCVYVSKYVKERKKQSVGLLKRKVFTKIISHTYFRPYYSNRWWPGITVSAFASINEVN